MQPFCIDNRLANRNTLLNFESNQLTSTGKRTNPVSGRKQSTSSTKDL